MSLRITNYNTLFVCCSDGDFDVIGSCEVKPPQSWCVMYPEMLDEVTSVGTVCTATVRRYGDQVIMNASESSSWELCDVGKLVKVIIIT